jgi:hypothetical protein
LSANLTDCDELDAAWTDCDFDDSAIAEIDAQLKARILESTLFSAFLHGNCTRTLTFENFSCKAEEEFSISFWFKDLDATQEPPIFRFFSSLAPLRMEMVVLRDGHFDVFDSAAQSHFYSAFETSEMEKNYRPGAWNAVSIG